DEQPQRRQAGRVLPHGRSERRRESDAGDHAEGEREGGHGEGRRRVQGRGDRGQAESPARHDRASVLRPDPQRGRESHAHSDVPAMSRRRALIAGLGAMGTSIALALNETWDVFYVDDAVSDPRGATKGRGNYADAVDLTIIATPEDAALRVLPQIRGLVTSICSLMGPLRRVGQALQLADFVAGHPMAGTEKSG